jgi:hypothetical protein
MKNEEVCAWSYGAQAGSPIRRRASSFSFCLSLLLDILPAHARRVDGPQRMQLPKLPLLRGQLRSEPEEVNVASGVVAMRHSGVAGHSVCAGRMPTLRCPQIPLMLGIILRVDLRPEF